MKKKGFTLIELLAVIVILAIIALIATPIIMNVIENTKEASYDRSVESIMHSAEIFAMDMKVTEDLELDQNIYSKIVDEISGDRPEEGQVYINKHGQIALSLKYGDYCYTKSYEEMNYYKEKTDTCITPFYYLPVTTLFGPDDSENVYFLNELGDESKPLIKKSEIEKIVTMSTNIVPEGVLGSWSVGVDKDGNVATGRVMAWYKDEDKDNLYEVYIGQEGGVKANSDSTRLFSHLTNVTEIDLSKLDTSGVENMTLMFYNCKKLTTLDLSTFDTSAVKKMTSMFYGCGLLTAINLNNFNTNKVTTMEQMFTGCSNLTSLELSNFNTENVTNMAHMFGGCKSLINLNLSNFNTSNVTDMRYMFRGCEKLTDIIVNKNWVTADENTEMFKNCGTDHVTVKQ